MIDSSIDFDLRKEITMICATFEPNIFENPLLPFYYYTRELSQQTELPNWHDYAEFLYCHSGNGTFNCNERCYSVSSGDFMSVNPFHLHSINTSSEIHFSYIHISTRFLEENGICLSDFAFQEHICDPELAAAFEALGELFHSETSHSILELRCAVLHFLLKLCKKYMQPAPHPHNDSSLSFQRIMAVIRFIQENLSAPITLEQLAKHVGISKSHLSRDFHQITDMTIIEYINQLRCREAQKLIQQGESVSAAAAITGFNNLSYFTRTYKKYLGELPSNNKGR